MELSIFREWGKPWGAMFNLQWNDSKLSYAGKEFKSLKYLQDIENH